MHVALVNCDAGGYMTMMVTPVVNQATNALSTNCDDAGYDNDGVVVDDDDDDHHHHHRRQDEEECDI